MTPGKARSSARIERTYCQASMRPRHDAGESALIDHDPEAAGPASMRPRHDAGESWHFEASHQRGRRRFNEAPA